jgi:hypothetical protein
MVQQGTKLVHRFRVGQGLAHPDEAPGFSTLPIPGGSSSQTYHVLHAKDDAQNRKSWQERQAIAFLQLTACSGELRQRLVKHDHQGNGQSAQQHQILLLDYAHVETLF